jgi:hypothetical protein
VSEGKRGGVTVRGKVVGNKKGEGKKLKCGEEGVR